DVIDADTAGMTQRRAQRPPERLEPTGPECPRVEGGDAPVLPGLVELVGRRTDADAVGHGVLPLPRVGTRRVDPDGEILDERDLATGVAQLPVEAPLHPFVEAHARRVRGSELGDGGRGRMAQRRRPLLPRTALLLVDRAE